MSTTRTIRFATLTDAPVIATLANSAYRGESSRAGWTTEADLLDGTRTDETDVANLINKPGRIIVVCDGDEIIGSVHIENRGTSSYLSMLVVNPELQASGVGRQLIQAAEDQARELWGSTKMTMSVITVRAELIAYYERRGYRRTGEIIPFVFDGVYAIPRVERLDMEILEKNLSG
jgi:ribosomal protein S18 acetylase RimI-like enzyme